MTATTVDRDTARKDIDAPLSYTMKGNTKIPAGVLVCSDASGYAVNAADTAAYHLLGRSNALVDTTSAGPLGQLADGVASIECEHGVFKFGNSGIVLADVGKLAYVLDNQTVCLSGGTSHTIAAGIIVAYVSATEVWIDTRKRSLTATT